MTPQSGELTEQFRAFIISLCDTDPGAVVADGRWHRFRIGDTRSKSSKPGRYLLHLDGRANGLFMDWRDGKRHQWKADGTYESIDRTEIERRRRERDAERRDGFGKAAKKAQAFWGECTKINGASHPYLDVKGIAPHGARYGSGEKFGLGKEDCVIIPLVSAEGKAKSLQAIRADGERRFWPGSEHEGAHHLIGKDDGASPIVFCEGFSTAASIHEATGWPVVMAITSGNMAAVARWAGHRWHGREMIVAGDDDWHLVDNPKVGRNVGRESAEAMARSLHARLVMPDMQGLVTSGGDDFNDIAREYGADEVRQAFMSTEGPAAPSLPLSPIDPGVWDGSSIPVRHWRLEGLIPEGKASFLTGAGAAGKSLAMQQLSTCVAMGLPFIGKQVIQSPALYITCEDDPDELHRRQAAICKAVGTSLAATSGRLHLLSLEGELGNNLATFDSDGTMQVAKRYTDIAETATALGVGFIVLDNTAHFFTGNENARDQVAAFLNLAARLAVAINGAVVIVGHPNKAGDSYSGSTAWENQVRSRLFLETPADEDGAPLNPDMRVMRNEKANYARRGAEVFFQWHEGAFVDPRKVPETSVGPSASDLIQAQDEELFLQLLDVLTESRRNTSHVKQGQYAPRIMVRMPQAQGVGIKRLEGAMERLFHAREIEANAELGWSGSDRKRVRGLARSRAI